MCHVFILDEINMTPLVNMDSIPSNEKWFTNIKLSVLETYPWQEDLMIVKMKMLVGLLVGEKLTNLVSISNNIAQLFFKKLQCTWCNLFLRNCSRIVRWFVPDISKPSFVLFSTISFVALPCSFISL
jgi:hypothetical protein